MSNLSNLKTAWETYINANITNDIIKYEALVLLDSYIYALTSQQKLENSEITSYSILGRSFTFRNSNEGKATVANLKAQLTKLVYWHAANVSANTLLTHNISWGGDE
jgi:hypothetical protein